MRLIVVSVLLLVSLQGLPALQAADECRDPCQSVSAPLPTGARKFYVYAQAASCVPPRPACSGDPPARVLGVVWEETNGLEGLQRKAGLDGSGPDRPVVY